MAATCWRPRSCRPASATRAAPRPASSAPSASRSRPAAPSTHKTPEQLAEVAKAAVELDGVKHMVMTTGTPPGTDRGAAVLGDSAAPSRPRSTCRSRRNASRPTTISGSSACATAGVDALGMHLEAVTPDVRARIMPGKAQVPDRALHRRPSRQPCRCSGAARSRPISSPASATPARRSSTSARTWSRSASIRSWCRSCRSPARRSKAIRAVAGLHACDPGAARRHAGRWRPEGRATSRPAAANAAPARRSRPTRRRARP